VSEVTVTPVTSSQLSSSSSESPMRSSSIRTAPETNQKSGWDVGGRDGIGERQSFNTAIRTIRIVRDARKERGEKRYVRIIYFCAQTYILYLTFFFFIVTVRRYLEGEYILCQFISIKLNIFNVSVNLMLIACTHLYRYFLFAMTGCWC